MRNEQFGYPLASEPEGIQWEQAVPVAHDLACKVQYVILFSNEKLRFVTGRKVLETLSF